MAERTELVDFTMPGNKESQLFMLVGSLVEQVKVLQEAVKELTSEQEKSNVKMAQIEAILNQGRGIWWTLAVLGSLSLPVIGAASWVYTKVYLPVAHATSYPER
ncbi:hypothetical protein [Methylocystis heyeri]|uniref:Uncharacterized protein n=1 Tax=Methylocystis heyeri TaxID=391905 RepID=A0A6B8KCG9_9HYPH|nr:hypothetical protein [Methylocystis heyeri]QGM46124.1 hypothetical protein H2LOC_010695 [Methylocystis heyeri]